MIIPYLTDMECIFIKTRSIITWKQTFHIWEIWNVFYAKKNQKIIFGNCGDNGMTILS